VSALFLGLFLVFILAPYPVFAAVFYAAAWLFLLIMLYGMISSMLRGEREDENERTKTDPAG
jgi:uncharacterized membrane protein